MADFKLFYNCPGCGKPSSAQDGALTSHCEYCNLIVRLGAPNRVLKFFYPSRVDEYGVRMAADRYLKSHGLPLTGDIINAQFYYLPFYRYRGIALDYIKPQALISAVQYSEGVSRKIEPKLQAKDFDITLPAFTAEEYSLVSLGVRPQSVPLYGLKKDEISNDIIVVGSDITPDQAEKKALAMRDSNILLYNKKQADFSAMVGERMSMIYFPVWTLTDQIHGDVRTVFIDALAKRAYNHIDKEFEYRGKLSVAENSHYLDPIRHQCPNCGADLDDDRFSLFYPCRNCDRAFILNESGGYDQVSVQSAETSFGAPFWRFPLVVPGQRPLRTVSEFSRLLTSEITFLRKEKRNNQFYLFSPAYKSSDVQRWCKNAYGVVLGQPHEKLNSKLPQKYLPLSISEAEARQMAIFLWRKLISRYSWNIHRLSNLKESDLNPGEIVWLPAQNYALISKAVDYKEVDILE